MIVNSKISYRLELASHESAYLWQLRLTRERGKKRRIIYLAIQRFRKLLELSRGGHGYAMIWLLEIRQLLRETLAFITTEQNNFMTVLNKRGVETKDLMFESMIRCHIEVESAIDYQLMELLRAYDRLHCLLDTLYQSGGFSSKKVFCNKRRSCQQLRQVLVKIIDRYPVRHIPKVTLHDFLNRTEKYQQAIKHWGEINPAQLRHALRSPLMVGLSTEQSNRALASLSTGGK